MRSGTKFFVFIASLGITYGVLATTVKRHYYGPHWRHHCGYYRDQNCKNTDQNCAGWDQRTDKTATEKE